MKIRFTESPVIILGTGIHKQNYEALNSLNDWHTLLKLIINENNLKNVDICESKYTDPTLLWEEIVTAFQNSSNQLRSLASYEAEYLLKKEVVSILTKRKFIQDKNYTIDKFIPSCIISLNFDTQWALGNIKRTKKYIPDRISDTCLTKSQIIQLYLRVWYQQNKKRVPVYFPNGSIFNYRSIRLGYRDFGLQSQSLHQAFKNYKKWERTVIPKGTKWDKNISFDLKSKFQMRNYKDFKSKTTSELSWVDYFMIKPLLFVGTGVGRSEIGLRWLLNQRKRNYQKTGESPKAIIIFENKTSCCDPCLGRELESLGLQLLLVDSYEKFWKEAKVMIS